MLETGMNPVAMQTHPNALPEIYFQSGRRLRRNESIRYCAESGCGTLLHPYNPGPCCHAHTRARALARLDDRMP